MASRIIPAILAAGLTTGPAIAQGGIAAIPLIDVERQEGGLGISGHVLGLSAGQVSATLEIAKSDGGGTVRSSQGREIAVAPGSEDIVAVTRLSTDETVSLTVILTLMSNGVAIGSTRMTIGQDQP